MVIEDRIVELQKSAATLEARMKELYVRERQVQKDLVTTRAQILKIQNEIEASEQMVAAIKKTRLEYALDAKKPVPVPPLPPNFKLDPSKITAPLIQRR